MEDDAIAETNKSIERRAPYVSEVDAAARGKMRGEPQGRTATRKISQRSHSAFTVAHKHGETSLRPLLPGGFYEDGTCLLPPFIFLSFSLFYCHRFFRCTMLETARCVSETKLPDRFVCTDMLARERYSRFRNNRFIIINKILRGMIFRRM
jgi:hypothetical protein